MSWSASGCEVSLLESDNTTTVCLCDHLTNFGIMFDYCGKADPDNKYLNVLSNILLLISIICIFITQMMILSKKRSSLIHKSTKVTLKNKKMAEMNKNWNLFLAQLSFLGLAGLQEYVSSNLCQFFGLFIHLAFLAFFSWTSKQI